MESIIIIVPKAVSLELPLRTVPTDWRVEGIEYGRFVIESEGHRAYVGVDEHAKDELEPDELRRVLGVIHEPTFYVLDYTDVGFCRELVSAVANRSAVLVDNDHGVVCSGSDFVAMLHSEPGWDWRVGPD